MPSRRGLVRRRWQNRPTKLDDYKPYLHQRWMSGFTNGWALWREITAKGYTGGYDAISAYGPKC